jgi:hypothetical protein
MLSSRWDRALKRAKRERALALILGIRATARVFAVAPNTVLQWLAEAAGQLRAFSTSLILDSRVVAFEDGVY